MKKPRITIQEAFDLEVGDGLYQFEPGDVLEPLGPVEDVIPLETVPNETVVGDALPSAEVYVMTCASNNFTQGDTVGALISRYGMTELEAWRFVELYWPTAAMPEQTLRRSQQATARPIPLRNESRGFTQ